MMLLPVNRVDGPAPPANGKPLHERVGWLGRLRGAARGGLFRFLRKLATTDDARAIQVDALRNVLPRRPTLPDGLAVDAQPYADLGRAGADSQAALRDDVVFITARFRSGSTLLWNLFRNLPGHTAYYEPFNERRWFDPAFRGSHTDPTHRKVEDYWREYDGLAELGSCYQERWIDRDLFMDAENWDPAMKRFVEVLIDRAPGRPVLQFNRIDFRLAWFRRHFPRAKIVHLYRHPRDQWLSSLVRPADCPRDATLKDFAARDHYYLCNWARPAAPLPLPRRGPGRTPLPDVLLRLEALLPVRPGRRPPFRLLRGADGQPRGVAGGPVRAR